MEDFYFRQIKSVNLEIMKNNSLFISNPIYIYKCVIYVINKLKIII